MNRKRRSTTVLALCLTLTSCAIPHALPAIRRPPVSVPPVLLKHGWDMPSVAWVAAHPGALESSPFDGVMLDSPLRDRVFSARPLSSGEAEAALAPYRDHGPAGLRHDFLLLFASYGGTNPDGPPDLSDDWSVVLENARLASAAAAGAGLAGIAWDNEPYGRNWFAWPFGRSGIIEQSALYRQRGAELIGAIEAGWPGAVVLVFLGPWASVSPDGGYRGPWPLLGPFVAGMGTAARSATLVDGGELYWLETGEGFASARDQMRSGCGGECPFLSAAEREAWPEKVGAGFGVFDRRWDDGRAGPPLPATAVTDRLRLALQATDRFVWYYTEAHDWWRRDPAGRLPPVPDGLVAAVRAARAGAHGR